jgi:spermidine synthase
LRLAKPEDDELPGVGGRVKRVERLGEAVAPDGSVLTLTRHDGDYSIRVDGQELMSTRRHHSEDVLADVVCEPLRDNTGARVLIGGLGMGFTLRAALRTLAADARVVVAEIMEEVIRWNQNPDYALAADALADPRVDLRHDDVANVLLAGPAEYDAIMLDVDNGAAAMTTRGNAGLYRAEGIRRAVAALRPGGRLAYWSAGGDPEFEKALRRARLDVEVVRARAHPGLKSFHTIFVAARAEPPASAESRAP